MPTPDDIERFQRDLVTSLNEINAPYKGMFLQVSLDETIQFLNGLLELDRPAIAALIANRVPCNESLANHPTVQVNAQHGGYWVGILGILNGLFGIDEKDGWGYIVAVFDDDTHALLRFVKKDEKVKPPV